jgi:hypothetical protein
MSDVDCTREARALWRAAAGVPWPRGWRCVLRNNPRSKDWGIADWETKTVVVYPHRSAVRATRTLLHELCHIFTHSNCHNYRFFAILGKFEARLGFRKEPRCAFQLFSSP